MSWYNLAKFGQIWNVEYRRDSVQSCLEALYQLTYKYQQMQIQQFKGYPKRQENMLQGIEKQSREVISTLVELLLPVFEKWLAGHALTNPKAWAENMIKDHFENVGSSPNEIAAMLYRFDYGNANKEGRQKVDSSYITEKLDDAIKLNQAPAFARWFKQAKDELQENDANNRDESDTRSEEQINEYYQNLEFSEYFSTYYGDDGNEWLYFFQHLAQFTDIEDFAIEIAQFGLFPAWYEYWQQQGIDETRDRLEKAYQMLQQVEGQPIGQALATINIVINTCHQTGSMLDYIVEATNDHKGALYRAMNNLSSLTHKSPEMKSWNKQLREVGTRVPRPPKPMNPPIEQKTNDPIDSKPSQIV